MNQPLPEEVRALVEARQPAELLRPTPQHLIPLPTPRRITAQVRARLNHFYVRTRLENPESLALLDGQQADGQQADGHEPDRGEQAGRVFLVALLVWVARSAGGGNLRMPRRA